MQQEQLQIRLEFSLVIFSLCLRDAQDMLGACPQAVLSVLSDQVEGL